MRIDLIHAENQVRTVTNFDELIDLPFEWRTNAQFWKRELIGKQTLNGMTRKILSE